VPKTPIRALTLGVAEPHPLPARVVEDMAGKLRRTRDAFEQAGYEVQTVRLSTRPVLVDLAGWAPKDIANYGGELQDALEGAEVPFCSLGPAPRDASPEQVNSLTDLIADHDGLNGSVMVATADEGLDMGAARAAAEVMQRLAAKTKEGFGNFRFAALACVAPGIPFFPAAYHAGPANLSLALQGAGIVAEALEGGAELVEVTGRTRGALLRHAGPVVELAEQQAAALGLGFAGIDLSPAPDVNDSIAAAIELAGHGFLGDPGTLALVAALTAALKSTGLPTCGFCGLMLPVMEDAVLARRWAEGRLGVDQLLAYSAICGTGLDTVPLPGDCSVDDLTKVISDMASLAVRLRKPLSARLLPVPGKLAGERTSFSSPYFTDTLIKPLR
jgi:uncharacterized protein (UPF0210 family)